MPRYFQEAAFLFGTLEGRNLDNVPFSQGIRDSFNRFMQAAAPYENADVDVARQALYPLFGETYYYEYYLMNNLPEY